MIRRTRGSSGGRSRRVDATDPVTWEKSAGRPRPGDEFAIADEVDVDVDVGTLWHWSARSWPPRVRTTRRSPKMPTWQRNPSAFRSGVQPANDLAGRPPLGSMGCGTLTLIVLVQLPASMAAIRTPVGSGNSDSTAAVNMMSGKRGRIVQTTVLCRRDLPTVIDLLAEDFVGRTSPVADDPQIRVLIAAGVLVPFVAVYAVLAADDAVEVIYIELG